jgi:anaerobic dimethyl sulfoxide reductase subunit A
MPVKYTTAIQTWWQSFLHDLEIHDANIASIKTTRLAEAILQGRNADPASIGCYKPLPSDIRMLYCVAWNPLNQLPNINKTIRALEKLDFIVVQDQRMTPTARWADILLPACTMLEREDFTLPWRECEPYLMAQVKAVEPYGNSRPDYWIFDRLAKRLGLKPLRLGRSPRAWLDYLLSLDHHGPFSKLARDGVLREERSTPWVAFREQVETPEKYPFQTPSGRIEIESRLLTGMDFRRTSYGQTIPALPTHLDVAPEPAKLASHPLKLLTTKVQFRCHSTLTGNPLLEEYFRQEIWIHPQDAAGREIADGQQVRVFNERGRLICAARLTERIKPGVVMIYEGAWYRPASDGTDLGGNPNLLTSDETSPAGAFALNSAWVEVAKE